MKRTQAAIFFIAIGAALQLSGCSPAYDWREVRLDPAPLVAMLPCKPDRATRPVAFGAQTLDIRMAGCKAGAATFTVASAQLADPARLAATLDLWQRSTVAQMRATGVVRTPFLLAGMTPVDGAGRLQIAGAAPDGSPVTSQAAWFVRGTTIFQAAVLVQGAGGLPADAADTFFSGLKLQ